MRIQIFNKQGQKAYTVPVEDSSVYVWKLKDSEYIRIVFNSDFVLQLKKGYYTDIPTLGRFEIVTLPSPNASKKGDGYEYELQMDRPWAKFKNRIMFMQRGSVLGMESKWSLTDTIRNHCSILTDNIAQCGFTYKGDNYHVVIHEGVDTEKSKLISYDGASILTAIGNIATAFDTEWWIDGDAIHFGRCERGTEEIPLNLHRELSNVTRSEDSNVHGTRLYAFGSNRNLNPNYRRKLKNPFTIEAWQTKKDGNKTYDCFCFKDIDIPERAINKRTTAKIEELTEAKKIVFVGVLYGSDNTTPLNGGKNFYRFEDGVTVTRKGQQKVNLSNLSMMYVNRLYTTPIDGQAQLAIQGVADNLLQLPIGTPYITYQGAEGNEDDIVEIREQNNDIYPRCLLTIDSVTTVDASETNEDTGEVTKWKAYRFTAKRTQDNVPFTFDDSYLVQEENKPLSIHFESGKLSGLEFEAHFNPEGRQGETRLFEITRNTTYTIALPNEVACPQVGDKLYLFNVDADIIDNGLIEAAEAELKEWAEKEMKKLCRDAGTYTGTINPVEWGSKRLGLLQYGQKVKLNAPHLIHTEDGKRSSRIIACQLRLNDLTQGDYTIGESAAYSRSENLTNNVQELVYFNGQIKDGQGNVSIGLYDKLITQLQKDNKALATLVGEKLSRLNNDEAKGLITFLKGVAFKAGKNITEMGDAELRDVVVRYLTAESLRSADFHAGLMDGSGFGIYKDEYGKSIAEVDKLNVRQKATFSALEYKRLAFTTGDVGFTSASAHLYGVIPLDDKGAPIVNSTTYFTSAGRQVLVNNALLSYSVTSGGKTVSAYRCYFLADDGDKRISNDWRIGDQAMCKTDNLISRTTSGAANRYYWRLVVDKGTETINGKMYHFIDLSNVRGTVNISDAALQRGYICVGYDTNPSVENDVPMAEDDLIQLGSQTDTDRQSAYIIYVSEGKRVDYAGVNDYNLTSHIVSEFSPKGTTVRSDKFTVISGAGTGISAPIVCDRGQWVSGTIAGHYDRFSYNGSLWLCNVGIGQTTNEAPSETSTKWIKQVSEGEAYSLEVTIESGAIYNSQGSVVLLATYRKGNVDISDTIPNTAWSWIRTSGQNTDAAWNNAHKKVGRRITVSAAEVLTTASFDCIIEG